jgi:uncharacterized phiE125 gp8 family phage protein
MAQDSTIQVLAQSALKTFLKISGATEDALLDSICDRTNALIKSYIGRNLVSQTYTEYYDGNGSAKLLLRNYPVVSLTSLHVDTLRAFGSVSEIVIADNVLLENNAGIIRLWNQGGVFLRGRANVKVVYVAGYATMPYDLVDAAILIASHSYKRHYQDQRIGLQSETIGDRTMTYSSEAIPAKAKLILDKYKRVSGGDYGY